MEACMVCIHYYYYFQKALYKRQHKVHLGIELLLRVDAVGSSKNIIEHNEHVANDVEC